MCKLVNCLESRSNTLSVLTILWGHKESPNLSEGDPHKEILLGMDLEALMNGTSVA